MIRPRALRAGDRVAIVAPPSPFDRGDFERGRYVAAETWRPGEATGPLLGGTLTPLVAWLGTPYAFDPPRGFVLFVNQGGERPCRIDRMWVQLAQSGILARAAAVVFGELPDCDEPAVDRAERQTP